MTDDELTRRRLLVLGVALPSAALVASRLERLSGEAAAVVRLRATPEIADADEPTPAISEGPFYTPRSPRRRSIVPAGARGTRLTLTGRVLTTSGRPVRRAVVDFWQCDARGVYDERGFRFRGHQLTDARGRYSLATVVPGLYPGRTRHIHVKVRTPGGRVLTTQLFFPGVPGNRSDGLFEAECVVRRWRRVGGARAALFDFVLDPA